MAEDKTPPQTAAEALRFFVNDDLAAVPEIAKINDKLNKWADEVEVKEDSIKRLTEAFMKTIDKQHEVIIKSLEKIEELKAENRQAVINTGTVSKQMGSLLPVFWAGLNYSKDLAKMLRAGLSPAQERLLSAVEGYEKENGPPTNSDPYA